VAEDRLKKLFDSYKKLSLFAEALQTIHKAEMDMVGFISLYIESSHWKKGGLTQRDTIEILKEVIQRIQSKSTIFEDELKDRLKRTESMKIGTKKAMRFINETYWKKGVDLEDIVEIMEDIIKFFLGSREVLLGYQQVQKERAYELIGFINKNFLFLEFNDLNTVLIDVLKNLRFAMNLVRQRGFEKEIKHKRMAGGKL